ncbi:MAG: Spy/CpxP family protein refolding chaperone [Planctomycetes bacterium]|nr:Spy/CpxP family protein refolding chaperone [Planctomycetota bacterium]
MKRTMMMLTTALALTVNVPVWARDAKPAEGAPPAREKAEKAKAEGRAPKAAPGLRGQYAIMASELKMTPEQQAQLQKKVEAREAAVKAWNEANGAKLAESQKALAEAKKNKDPKAAELKAEVDKLAADKEKVNKDSMVEVERVFTPEQKKTWAGYEVYVGATGHFSRVKLSDEQKAKARQLAQDTSAILPAEGKDRKAALNALYSKIEAEVLTDEQRAQLKAPPTPRAAPAPKAEKAKEPVPAPAPAAH